MRILNARLEHDFYYIQNWSLRLDLKIIWKTIRGGFIDKSVRQSGRGGQAAGGWRCSFKTFNP